MTQAPPPSRTPPRRRPGPRHVLTVGALTAVALLAAASTTPWRWTPPDWLLGGPPTPPTPTAPTTTPTPTPSPPPTLPTDQGGFPIGDYLLALGGLLTLLALLALLRILARNRNRTTQDAPLTAATGPTSTHTETDTVLPHLRDAVRTAHDELHPDIPPPDAIVAAWVTLENAAALAGAERDPAQTPTEFAVRVLERTPADPAAVTTLRDLYHRARFRGEGVDADDVTTAREALARIGADLDVDPTRSPLPGDHP
ncbi:DUF4129 domain-containing protein [Cellulosimicrobium terreum]|nr:DUF4129 domain-containing protein [Cellulosimicrobium terreum]